MATPPTYSRQSQKYDRRIRLCVYLAGALGGIAVLGAGDAASGLYASISGVYRAVLFTLLVVAGGLVGLAYSGFDWAKTIIDRAIEDRRVIGTDQFDPGAYPVPSTSDKMYRAATVLVVVAGAWLLLCVWLAA